MTTTEKEIYKSIARLLYKQGKSVDSKDKAAVELIGGIAYSLIELDGKYEEKYDMGIMHEIDLWMGLKLDAPEMADAFGAKIKLSYPDIFKTTDKPSSA